VSETKSITLKLSGEVIEVTSYRIFWMARVLYSSVFEVFIALVIGINAIALAYLTFPNVPADAVRVAENVDQIAFLIYCVELVFRIISYGKKPWMFFQNGWNVFDFIVIGLAPFLQGQTAVLRLLRLMRLLRIFRFLPEVRILTTSIIKSIPPLLSMSVLVGLLLFMYAMAGTYIFGASLPQSWGDLGLSMKSLIILLTLENFPNYLEEGIAVSPIAFPFFLSYVFIIVFTVLNVLIGIVLHAMDQARDEIASEKSDVEQLQKLVKTIDKALEDGVLSDKEKRVISQEIDTVQRIISSVQKQE
jgi:voltage-gated sodium channel